MSKIVSRKLMGDTAYEPPKGRRYGGYMEVYVQEDEWGAASVAIDLKAESAKPDKWGGPPTPHRFLERQKLQQLTISASELPTFLMIMKMALAEVEAKNAKPAANFQSRKK